MNKVFTLVLTLLAVQCVKSQSVSTFMGARVSAMGNVTSCLTDEWSVFNNIGGLSKVKGTTAAFSCEVRPTLKSANRFAALITTPIRKGVFGAGVFHFGDDLYNEHLITVGYSNQIGITSLGVKLNYVQYSAEGFGTRGVISASIGAITQLTPILSIGTHIVNIVQPKISRSENEKLPTRLVIGIGLKTTETLFITTEIEKSLNLKPNWKAGFEYTIHKKIFFRSGFTINPDVGFMGLGFTPKKFKFDYAYRYEPNLGGSHQASVCYKFKSK